MARRAGIIAQAQAIAQRGVDANRDLTAAEQTEFDGLIADAEKIHERAKAIHEGELRARERPGPAGPGQLTGCPSLLVSPDNIRRHVEALRAGETFSVTETRGMVQVNGAATSSIGGATAWGQLAAREPNHLIRFAGIPVDALTGVQAVMPTFTLPSAAVGVAESAAHTEFDGVVDLPLTALRYGRWTQVSAAASEFTSLSGIVNAHAIAIARDIDKKAVADIEAAITGSPIAYNADVAGNVRQTILAVAANTMRDVSELVLVGTVAAIAKLQDVAPANGPDAGSITTRFAGARLYPATTATAGRITVFDPQSFMAFASPVGSATAIDPKDGSASFGSWLHHTAIGQGLTGSALAVTVVDPG
ncbi:hypothetical protein [Mycolicibacterium brumae]|nr:hypothetical protein [Mycolicibacterium brumae]MCV7191487.1 hypothetical protein [Mycolicibacterium brumae]UWW09406.1 hypothetical protein L2Z93_002503 [Mycolicibacterium brumae]